MRSFIITILLILVHTLSFAWNNTCYPGSLPSISFPREGRSLLTLEATRVVSVQGNVMVYDLGKEKVVIKMEGIVPVNFLKDVQKSRCTAKTLVSLEVEKKGFSDTGIYRATTPGPR